MTPEETYNAFDKIIHDVQSDAMGNIMVQIGVEATTRIRERIIKSGQNADGGQFPAYSTKPMLAGCKGFINQSKCPAKNKKGRDELKWVTIQRGGKNVHLYEITGGYKEFRDMNDRQSGFVDFSFSNRMWSNIKIVSANSEHNKGTVRIAATTDLDKKKLEGNTKRKGDILKLSSKEINELSEEFNRGIVQIFHNNGL